MYYYKSITFWGLCPVILEYYKYSMSSIIHANEIWQSSQCLEHEEAAVGMICVQLNTQGYQTKKVISHTRSIWQRGSQTVAVSLVDDVWNCALDCSQDTPYLFDADTTVITDNWINTHPRCILWPKCPTVFMASMPISQQIKTGNLIVILHLQ